MSEQVKPSGLFVQTEIPGFGVTDEGQIIKFEDVTPEQIENFLSILARVTGVVLSEIQLQKSSPDTTDGDEFIDPETGGVDADAITRYFLEQTANIPSMWKRRHSDEIDTSSQEGE